MALSHYLQQHFVSDVVAFAAVAQCYREHLVALADSGIHSAAELATAAHLAAEWRHLLDGTQHLS